MGKLQTVNYPPTNDYCLRHVGQALAEVQPRMRSHRSMPDTPRTGGTYSQSEIEKTSPQYGVF